ncbi:MAG: hypothetical protein AAGA61_07880 [Pseudomonadota bacterium]
MDTQRTATLLTVLLAGMLTMILFEIMRGLGVGAYAFDPSSLPPVGMLTGVVALTSLPVILLSVSSGKGSRWVSLVITGLMTLFHGLHILEHVMIPDYELAVLIGVTMLLPNAIATAQLWSGRRTTLVAEAA